MSNWSIIAIQIKDATSQTVPAPGFWARSFEDPAVFWLMVSSLATITLIAVAYWQLKNLAKTSRSDFLYRLKSDFFNEQARKLIFLAENNLLEFHDDKIPYFSIIGHEDPIISHRLKDFGIKSEPISTHLIDDILLGPMEDIGVLEKLGMVSLEEVYEGFVTYVEICVENPAIRSYLDCDHDPEDDDVYDNVMGLYRKLKLESPKIRARKRRAKNAH